MTSFIQSRVNMARLSAIAAISVGVFTMCCAKGATTHTVMVGQGGFFFVPSSLTIAQGDTVMWVWSASGHSSTSGTPGSPDGMWDSGVLSMGSTFSFTFNSAGSFPYYCTPHGLCCGMVGSVTVEAIDTVDVTRAQYAISRSQLTVQATDSNPTAVLTVAVTSTGEVLGQMMNRGGGSYTAKFNGIANPQKITVTSNLGGSDTSRVKAR